MLWTFHQRAASVGLWGFSNVQSSLWIIGQVLFNCTPNNAMEIGNREGLLEHKKMHGKADFHSQYSGVT